MKEIGEVNFNPQPDEQVSYQQMRIVKQFVAEVLKLYSANKIESFRVEEQRVINGVKQILPDGSPKMFRPNFENVCNQFARDILGLSESERLNRLSKIRKLYQAEHKAFQWPHDAIAHGTAPSDQFNMMYSAKFAVGQDAVAQKPINQNMHKLEHLASDDETGKKYIQEMKDLWVKK